MSAKTVARVTAGSAEFDFRKGNGLVVEYRDDTPSLTRQEFAEECDINAVMARYDGHVHGGPGGLSPTGTPMYFDFAEMPTDLLSYMTLMQEAETAFMTLPAVVRREFDNSAVSFVDFASNPENLDQMREWGLAAPKKLADEPRIEPVPAPPAGGPSPGGAASTPST